MSAEPVLLPQTPPEPSRPPLPLLAALVPVAAGIVMWAVTGSALSLCFAFVGPLMIVGSFVDGNRRRRRERRRADADAEAAWRRVDQEIDERRDLERANRWARHPDALRCLIEAPLREDAPLGPNTTLVIGAGSEPSTIRVSGGDGGERARAARERAATVDEAPVVVPLGRGLCIRAEPVLADAVLRALVAQLCLRFAPARLALVGAEGGAASFPHARAVRREAFRLCLGTDPAEIARADAILRVLDPQEPVPDGVTTMIEGVRPDAMTLRTPEGTRAIAVECLSSAQLTAIAESCTTGMAAEAALADRVLRSELSPGCAAGLAAAIGRGLSDDVTVDLVADGPHAIVTGMTGAGKSELLVTWITALAERRRPEEVSFLLADFKGGTAFDPLRALPHVTAVLTDLDDDGADRGIRSLTAELRRRERTLADAGVRDIAEVDLPRLVIVVDEFAALLQEHPDLAAVFTDIAARGRALGMHLILGTQRAAGVIRDALAANCPLRISLRVADPADSRWVIGSDDAALLEGGPASRGIACVRRPQDAEPLTVRIALTDAADLRAVAMRWSGAPRPAGPWLPALRDRIPLTELPAPTSGGALLGVADEPDQQAQPVVEVVAGRDRGLAILGGPGAGKTTAIRLLRRQCRDARVIPADAEAGWDTVEELTRGVPAGSVILGDDIDRLLASLPPEHAQACAESLEGVIRGSGDALVVLSAARASGPVARVLEALPDRMLLRMATRTEHFAAGGEADSFRHRPPGRGVLSRREVQIAWIPSGPADEPVPAVTRVWRPERRLTGIVCSSATRTSASLAERFPDADVRAVVASSGDGRSQTRPAMPTVLVGDPDDWQREWSALQRVRAEGEMLIAAEHPAALRVLLGDRSLPPYAKPHAGRAWAVRDGGRPERVLLPF